MSNLKIPLTEETLYILHEALRYYRNNRGTTLPKLSEMSFVEDWKESVSYDKQSSDEKIHTLMNMPADVVRAQANALEEREAEIDILIARVQILKKKMKESGDSTIVDDLFEEVMSK